MTIQPRPYRVVIERHSCAACGRGLLWTVEGPPGDAGGPSYEIENDAREDANAMNHAYELGYQAKERESEPCQNK
jgi:hypothetical protein